MSHTRSVEARMARLACVLASERPPWLPLLDERTNRLDFYSIKILKQALHACDGALLVVIHDRAFLAAIGIGRTFAVAGSCIAALNRSTFSLQIGAFRPRSRVPARRGKR